MISAPALECPRGLRLTTMRASRRLLVALALAAAAATVALVWDGTRYPGPGLYGDGAAYLGAAESLVHDGGLRVPFATYESADSTSVLAQWPPGFPVVLSVPLWARRGPMAAIRIVQAAVGGCTVALTAIVVATATAPVWGAAVAVALLVTPAIVAVHLNVVSEPLYLLCLAIMLWSNGLAFRPPLAYGMLAAAAVLVRYLGLAAIAGAGVWAALQPGPSRVRARRAAIAHRPGTRCTRFVEHVHPVGGGECAATACGPSGGRRAAPTRGFSTCSTFLPTPTTTSAASRIIFRSPSSKSSPPSRACARTASKPPTNPKLAR